MKNAFDDATAPDVGSILVQDIEMTHASYAKRVL